MIIIKFTQRVETQDKILPSYKRKVEGMRSIIVIFTRQYIGESLRGRGNSHVLFTIENSFLKDEQDWIT